MSVLTPHIVTAENAQKMAGWIRERGGIAVWPSINFSNLGVTWSTPARNFDGTPTTKPIWQSAAKPERITDPADLTSVHTIRYASQVQQYDPLPNPAKTTDSRFVAYMQEFGDESWELDALEPSVLDSLIRTAVSKLINKKLWKEREATRDEGREKLRAAAARLNDD
jgi:hypothetical protein